MTKQEAEKLFNQYFPIITEKTPITINDEVRHFTIYIRITDASININEYEVVLLERDKDFNLKQELTIEDFLKLINNQS